MKGGLRKSRHPRLASLTPLRTAQDQGISSLVGDSLNAADDIRREGIGDIGDQYPPIGCVRPVARLRPTALSRKFDAGAVHGLGVTSGLPRKARDTVECETVAARAMSLMERDPFFM